MNNFQSFLAEYDFSSDVIGAYLAYREKQLCSAKQAVNNVHEDFSGCLNDDDDRPVFWVALAFAMAERNELTKRVMKNALIHLEDSYFKERYAEPFDFDNEIEEIKKFLESGIGPSNIKKGASTSEKAVWNINDCYAFQLKSEKANELGVCGRFLIFHIVEYSTWQEKVIPVVHMFLSTDANMPRTADEISSCIPIPTRTFCTPYTFRFRISNKRSIVHVKNGFFFIGNFDNISFPNESIESNVIFCPPIDLRYFEKNALASIEPFGIDWLQNLFS